MFSLPLELERKFVTFAIKCFPLSPFGHEASFDKMAVSRQIAEYDRLRHNGSCRVQQTVTLNTVLVEGL